MFDDILNRIHDDLGKLEASAGKLTNQNLSDILKSARAKVGQVLAHPEKNAAAAIHNSEVNYNASAYVENA